jgi:C2H2-type zinc finger
VATSTSRRRTTKSRAGTGRSRAGGTTKSRVGRATQSRAGQFVCPECGRKFDRPQALGAHRRQAHGVVGTSTRSASRRATTSATKPATMTRARRRSGAATNAGRPRGQARASEGVDRDRLLRSLFPDGIPARQELIRDINSWLDEAERLARSR